MNNAIKSLIQLYKTLDDSKHLIEDVINELGKNQQHHLQGLPKDVQDLIKITLDLNPDQRKTLMKFIESLKQE